MGSQGQDWDKTYRDGRLAFLAGLREAARYGVVSAYVEHSLDGGSLLDLGCGPAILCRHLNRDRITRYVGVDVAASALEGVETGIADSRLVCADIAGYEPDGRFDAVVFNEVLSFVPDPIGLLRRSRGWLSDHGVVIVSIYRKESRGTRKLIEAVEAEVGASPWQVLDATRLSNTVKGVTWQMWLLK